MVTRTGTSAAATMSAWIPTAVRVNMHTGTSQGGWRGMMTSAWSRATRRATANPFRDEMLPVWIRNTAAESFTLAVSVLVSIFLGNSWAGDLWFQDSGRWGCMSMKQKTWQCNYRICIIWDLLIASEARHLQKNSEFISATLLYIQLTH